MIDTVPALRVGGNDGQPPATKVAKKETDYWNGFYSAFKVAVPSQFCAMVATEAPIDRPFVEFGCGNGRDAIYMARQGFQVFAGDLSSTAIRGMQQNEEAQQQTTNKNKKHPAQFVFCDVSNSNDVQSLVRQAREAAADHDNSDSNNKNVTLYNRFFLHALDDEQEAAFLDALADATIPGDALYMEFRCSLDAVLDKEHGKGHFRRYVDTKKLIKLLLGLGFTVKYQITGQGMAKFKAEDPFVSRVICERL
mmetsp:Transcript_14482/g.21265  ORF Transcript_14482/g.21265 Transcript_14482/m.21265 type:complete len:251 (-) Transcript_14482:137-889(-)